MVGGSGPTRGGEAAPLRALALGQIGQTLAGERHRRNPIGLRPEFRAVRLGTGGEGLEIVVVAEFAEGEAPIVADGASRGANVAGQGGQVWRQVIAAPLRRPEGRAVRLGPGGEGLEIVVVAEFAEGEAPIVADGASRGANVAGQGGQVWRQVI